MTAKQYGRTYRRTKITIEVTKDQFNFTSKGKRAFCTEISRCDDLYKDLQTATVWTDASYGERLDILGNTKRRL
jgi:hypothetical protein